MKEVLTLLGGIIGTLIVVMLMVEHTESSKARDAAYYRKLDLCMGHPMGPSTTFPELLKTCDKLVRE